MKKSTNTAILALSFAGLLFSSGAIAAPMSNSTSTIASHNSMTLENIVHMETELKIMKMQAEIKTAKLHLLSIDAQIAGVQKKDDGLSALSKQNNPLRILSTGCFQGKCTATVEQGHAQFTVNTGEQLNGYHFLKISSGGVMVSENGYDRWLGIDGVTTKNVSPMPAVNHGTRNSINQLPPVSDIK